MTEIAEAHYLDRLNIAAERLSGVAVARHGYGRHLRRVRMIEAGHPIPDAAGLEGADRALKLADDAGKNDLVLVLMSGGASANLVAPAQGISFEDKQAVTRALLALRCDDQRDQCRAETSVAHQGRASGGACASGETRDDRDLDVRRRPLR